MESGRRVRTANAAGAVPRAHVSLKPCSRKEFAVQWRNVQSLYAQQAKRTWRAGAACDRIGGMASADSHAVSEVDFSLLDVPRSVPVNDPEAYLRAAIAWHFGEDTGSPFWLRTAQTLNFNPLTDVKTFTDLRWFPNLVNEL